MRCGHAKPGRTARKQQPPIDSGARELGSRAFRAKRRTYSRIALKRYSGMNNEVGAGLRCTLQHAQLLLREAQLRGLGAALSRRARRGRERECAEGRAEPDRGDDCGGSGGALQLPRDGQPAPWKHDRDIQLLQRRVVQEARGLRRPGRVRPAAGANGQMRLQADALELRELAVERRRDELAHSITRLERNLPH